MIADQNLLGSIPSILFGVAAVIGAIGSSVAAIFGALAHRTIQETKQEVKEVKAQTNGINDKLRNDIEAKNREIAELKNGG